MSFGSVASNFAGPSGALVMSLIAMSIVFLVIIGLMFVMLSTHKVVSAIEKKDKTREVGK
ncbi:OadG family protein [Synergistaceae bacterium OttesenSCG-928-D05]|nr:OadG family protein [Synergistaceae bacterium OttesenSCG-928-D05]